MEQNETNPWKEWTPNKIEIRNGSRAPWIEVRVTKTDGTVVKLVMKKVPAFYSERDQSAGDLA